MDKDSGFGIRGIGSHTARVHGHGGTGLVAGLGQELLEVEDLYALGVGVYDRHGVVVGVVHHDGE